MRFIHLSDLHFGTEHSNLLNSLIAHLKEIPADMVVISGDFTQTASRKEFKSARDFLEKIDMPFFCVPGNHDIPRANLIERLTNPYARYKEFIADDLEFSFRKDGVCIAGINTARRVLPHWNWANGAVAEKQLKFLENFFISCLGTLKICVMHHPVHKAEGNPLKTVVFGGGIALERLKKMKVDLVLTGHVHHASITTFENDGHKTIFLSASTALSSRLRRQANGYNVITNDGNILRIEVFSYIGGLFHREEVFEHARSFAN